MKQLLISKTVGIIYILDHRNEKDILTHASRTHHLRDEHMRGTRDQRHLKRCS